MKIAEVDIITGRIAWRRMVIRDRNQILNTSELCQRKSGFVTILSLDMEEVDPDWEVSLGTEVNLAVNSGMEVSLRRG